MHFKQGDIIVADLDPVVGHEQAGRRPMVIISNNDYLRLAKPLCIACPISNTDNDYPMHVPLDRRTHTTGSILCQHVKTLDLSKRNAQKKEECPPDILDEVIEIVQQSIVS